MARPLPCPQMKSLSVPGAFTAPDLIVRTNSFIHPFTHSVIKQYVLTGSGVREEDAADLEQGATGEDRKLTNNYKPDE